MARQQIEQYQQEYLTCLSEFGLNGVVGVGGGIVGIEIPSDANDEPLPGASTIVDEAGTECSERVAQPRHWVTVPDSASYQRTLDVRGCLVAHGARVSEAPSFETWAESAHPWNPFEEIFTAVTQEEFLRFAELCPQAGYGQFVVNF
jgi:hypothetical protein